MRNIKKIIIYTVILTIISGAYVIMAPVHTAVPLKSWRADVGEATGSGLLWLLVIIYGRTLLKLLVNNGSLMERLLPEPAVNDTKSMLKKFIRFLNKTHPYVGVTTVVLVFGHTFLEGVGRANLLMDAILVLALWQFAFGAFLLTRYQLVFVKKMKRYSYMAHSQLYTGVAFGVFALFGHLLVGD